MHNKRIVFFLAGLCLTMTGTAQKMYSTANLDLDGDIATWYSEQAGLEKTTLTLGQYNENSRKAVQSHPFFDSPSWIQGEISYRGQEFSNISIVYNINDDVLLIRHPDIFKYANQPLQLNQKQVDWFRINGHTFKYFEGTDPAGFLEVLHEGDSVSLLSKKLKTIFVNSSNQSEYQTDFKYYFYINGELSRIYKKFNFWRKFPEHKSEIKAFIKSNKIPAMKNASDQQMASIAAYCDQLINKTAGNE